MPLQQKTLHYWTEAHYIQIQKSTGDYHDDMFGDHFEVWFATKLLPNIPRNSLIVRNNALYHSHHSDHVPDKSWKKKMQD